MKVASHLTLLLAFGSLTAACIPTSRSAKTAVLTATQGDDVRISLMGGVEIHGELIAVDDTSLLVVRDRRVLQVPGVEVRQVQIGFDGFAVRDGKLSISDAERLRRHARFPFGVSDTAMSSLLRASGQDAPEVISWPKR